MKAILPGKAQLSFYFRSAVFKRFMCSYLLAFLIPMVLLFGFLYWVNARTLEEEVYSLQSTYVSQIQYTLDNEAQRFRTYAVMLANNADLKTLYRKQRDDLTASDLLRLRNLRGTMANFTASDNGISRSFLYLSSANMLVDSTRALSVAEVTQALLDSGMLPGDMDAWQQIYQGVRRGTWLRTLNSRGDPQLYYVQSILPMFSRTEVCNLIIIMQPSYLSEVFHLLDDHNGGWVALFSHEGDQLWCQSVELEPPISLDTEAFTGMSGQLMHDGFLYSYCRSQYTDDWFVSAISQHSIHSALQDARNLAIITFIVCLCLCAYITYIATIHNYRPIAQLANMTPESEADDYTRLRVTLIEAEEAREKLTQRNEHAIQVKADEHLLQALEQGHLAALTNRLKKLDLPSPLGHWWALAHVEPIDYTSQEEDLPGLLSLMQDVFASFAAPPYAVVPLMRKDTMLMLLNLPSDEAHHIAYYKTSLQRSLQFIRDNYAVDCKVCISAAHDCQRRFDLDQMQQELRLAGETLAMDESVSCYNAMQSGKVQRMAAEQTMYRLLNASLNGDSVQSRRLLEALSAQIDALTAQAVSMEQTNGNEEDSREMRLKRSIIDIVQNEYPNPMLNVSYIANKLGKNVDYISRIFKATTTVGLLDYIHHVRVKAAKGIMRADPHLPIAKVAQQAGYIGTDSFIRAFKRIEGTTPGRYRDTKEGSHDA